MLRCACVLLSAISILALPAAAASAPSFPLKLTYEDSFSIAPEGMPPGCSLVSSYTDKGRSAKVTCQTKAQWDAGFAVGGEMMADCSSDSASPYVCSVHKH